MEMTPEAEEPEHREHHLFHHHSHRSRSSSHSSVDSDGSDKSRSKSKTKSKSRSRSTSPRKHHFRHSLDFPFKENTIARRAQAPGPQELSYQFSPVRGSSKPLPLSGAATPEEGRSPTRMDTEVNVGEQIRKGKLAKRLQEVFGLPDEEEIVEEMACWLLRSSLLKGYMFLTPQRICFFAHLPEQDVS